MKYKRPSPPVLARWKVMAFMKGLAVPIPAAAVFLGLDQLDCITCDQW